VALSVVINLASITWGVVTLRFGARFALWMYEVTSLASFLAISVIVVVQRTRRIDIERMQRDDPSTERVDNQRATISESTNSDDFAFSAHIDSVTFTVTSRRSANDVFATAVAEMARE
jgi:hypothetical protein